MSCFSFPVPGPFLSLLVVLCSYVVKFLPVTSPQRGARHIFFCFVFERLRRLGLGLSLQQVSLLVFRSMEDTPGVGDARHGRPSRSLVRQATISSHIESHDSRHQQLLGDGGGHFVFPVSSTSDLRRSGTTLVQDPISTVIEEERSLFMHDLA